MSFVPSAATTKKNLAAAATPAQVVKNYRRVRGGRLRNSLPKVQFNVIGAIRSSDSTHTHFRCSFNTHISSAVSTHIPGTVSTHTQFNIQFQHTYFKCSFNTHISTTQIINTHISCQSKLNCPSDIELPLKQN